MHFIQAQRSLVSHRKTLRLARLLGIERYAVVGRLVALWSWCLDYAPDGVLSDDVDDKVLADVMGRTANMGNPDDLVEALYGAGFIALAEDEADDRWHVGDWDDLMAHAVLSDAEAVDEPADEEE